MPRAFLVDRRDDVVFDRSICESLCQIPSPHDNPEHQRTPQPPQQRAAGCGKITTSSSASSSPFDEPTKEINDCVDMRLSSLPLDCASDGHVTPTCDEEDGPTDFSTRAVRYGVKRHKSEQHQHHQPSGECITTACCPWLNVFVFFDIATQNRSYQHLNRVWNPSTGFVTNWTKDVCVCVWAGSWMLTANLVYTMQPVNCCLTCYRQRNGCFVYVHLFDEKTAGTEASITYNLVYFVAFIACL